MPAKRYAIVDIETTGMTAHRDKITEIAIVLHDGEKVIDTYETLLNPERAIPYQITQVTGISDVMVANAPKFYEVAKQIVQLTEGAIFVAHNARFDYSFIQEEFRRLGYTFTRRQLCTVKLSRQVFPNLRSYSLGSLIQHFGIKVTDRHRAMADAMATTELFNRILTKKDSTDKADQLVNKGLKTNNLPNGISLDQLHKLPETCGVYYFHDKNNEVIYVGKSINIQKRIFEHFADKTPKGDKIQQSVFDISYEETGSELIALLLEDAEIKRLKPAINRAQRKTYFPYAVFSYTDELGYRRFHAVKNVAEVRRKNEILMEFTKLYDAKNFLTALSKRFELCENMMNPAYTPLSNRGCFNHQIGQCQGACIGIEPPEAYNLRADAAIERLVSRFESDFFILENGRTPDEKAAVWVKDGYYQGFGYVDGDAISISTISDAIKPARHTADTHRIIRLYLQQHPSVKLIKN